MSDPMSSYATFDLERRKVGMQYAVTRDAVLDVGEDYFRNQLMYRLTSYVMAHQLEKQTATNSVQVPSSWWQAFKLSAIEDGNPMFRRHKVKMRTLTIEAHFTAWAGFPECTMEFPKELGRARIYMENSSSARWDS
jgi:hypothetical protein